jgi:ribosome-associated heat shock protein Hsp15
VSPAARRDDGDDGAAAEATATDSQRLDRWLWHARVVKTRSAAATLVTEGKVRVDGQRVDKPAHTVRLGTVVTVVLRGGLRLLEVRGFADRRGSAPAAAALFADRSPPRPSRPTGPPPPAPAGHREAGAGRPTKRDRRRIDRFRGA